MNKRALLFVFAICCTNAFVVHAADRVDECRELFNNVRMHNPIDLAEDISYGNYIKDIRDNATEEELEQISEIVVNSVLHFNPYAATNHLDVIDPCRFIESRAGYLRRVLVICNKRNAYRLTIPQAKVIADKIGTVHPLDLKGLQRGHRRIQLSQLNNGIRIFRSVWEQEIVNTIVFEAHALPSCEFSSYTNKVITAAGMSKSSQKELVAALAKCEKHRKENLERKAMPRKWHRVMPDGSLKEIDDEGLSPIR